MNTIKVKDLQSELNRYHPDAYITLNGEPFGKIEGGFQSFRLNVEVPAVSRIEEKVTDLEDEAETISGKLEGLKESISELLENGGTDSETLQKISDLVNESEKPAVVPAL